MVSRDGNRAESAPRAHITLVRPPAISSRFSYTIGVVLPLGPAYLAGTLLEAGYLVAAVDGLGEAPFQRGPTSRTRPPTNANTTPPRTATSTTSPASSNATGIFTYQS